MSNVDTDDYQQQQFQQDHDQQQQETFSEYDQEEYNPIRKEVCKNLMYSQFDFDSGLVVLLPRRTSVFYIYFFLFNYKQFKKIQTRLIIGEKQERSSSYELFKYLSTGLVLQPRDTQTNTFNQ